MTNQQSQAIRSNDLNYLWKEGSYVIAANMHPYNGIKRISVSGRIETRKTSLEKLTSVWR